MPGTRFVYSGRFRDELSVQLIAMAEHFEGLLPQGRAQRHRLAFLMVESYQNIIRHRHADRQGACSFQFHDLGEEQRIAAINPIEGPAIEVLRKRLAELEAVAPDRLKQLYLAGLTSNKRDGQRGAGLGLIEMTRRSGRDLLMNTRPGPEGEFKLLLLARCGDNGDGDAERIETAWAMHEDLVAEEGVFAFSGCAGIALQGVIGRMLDIELHDDLLGPRLKGALLAFFSLGRGAAGTPFITWALRHSAAGWSMSCAVDLPNDPADRIADQWKAFAALAPLERNARYKRILIAGPELERASSEADLLELMQSAGQCTLIVSAKGDSTKQVRFSIGPKAG